MTRTTQPSVVDGAFLHRESAETPMHLAPVVERKPGRSANPRKARPEAAAR